MFFFVAFFFSFFALGILPHDGKNIRFNELAAKVDAAFNTAPTISLLVTKICVRMLMKNYKRGTFDLAELDLHNGIEHDASLTRTCLFSDGPRI